MVGCYNNAMKKYDTIPDSLRLAFTIHFIVDIIFAIPLLLFPHWFLGFLGFPDSNLVFVRLLGATLAAIGTTSHLMKNGGVEAYRAMLSLKMIFSLSVVLGILLSLNEAPWIAAYFSVGFMGYFTLWSYFRARLRR